MPGPALPTEDEITWMLAHPEDSKVAGIIAACSICTFAATIFLALRLVSRRILHGSLRLYLNDWLVIIAWVLYIPFAVFFGLTTRYGGGRHIVYATDVRLLQILNLCNENLYACILAFLKLSIVSLYRQIFGSVRVAWFDRLTWAAASVAIALAVQVLVTTNLQCIPISMTWDPSIEGKCFDYGKSALVAYVVNAVTELTLLSMPIPLVLRLQVSKQKKWMLLLTFSAGAGTCIISLVQFKYITMLGQTADPTWDNIPPGLLACAELMMGILAASIPTYRPLYRYLFARSSADDSSSSHPLREGASNRFSQRYDSCSRPGRYPNGGSHNAKVSVRNDPATEGIYSNHRRGILITDQVELLRYNKMGGSWVRVDDKPEHLSPRPPASC